MCKKKLHLILSLQSNYKVVQFTLLRTTREPTQFCVNISGQASGSHDPLPPTRNIALAEASDAWELVMHGS